MNHKEIIIFSVHQEAVRGVSGLVGIALLLSLITLIKPILSLQAKGVHAGGDFRIVMQDSFDFDFCATDAGIDENCRIMSSISFCRSSTKDSKSSNSASYNRPIIFCVNCCNSAISLSLSISTFRRCRLWPLTCCDLRSLKPGFPQFS